MKQKFKNFWQYLSAHKLLLALIIIVLVGIVWYVVANSKKTTYQFVSVTRGVITETVAVTGNTTSTNSVSLAFQNGGTIASVEANLGNHVSVGETIASLDTSALRAQLQEAQANVDAENAQLQTLLAGATPQTVAVSQAALTSANQSLANTYAGAPNTLADGYTKANDAVRNQLQALFSSAETNSPQFLLTINDTQIVNDAEFERLEASAALNGWQADLLGISVTSTAATLDTAISKTQAQLTTIKQLLATVAAALTEATNLPVGVVATYQTDVTNATNEVNAAITNLSTVTQAIATEKSAIAQAQAQLNLTLASSTPETIAAQQAQVEQAQASEQNIKVQIAQDSIVSPIDGLVTTQDAKVGQIASPGAPLVRVLGNGGFEVNADVSEVDIGKISLNDPVSMTLDAFPGETFNGTVFYINPAETVNGGVVDYEIRISFNKPDPRIKSGLTANCNIMTQTDTGALILPQYAVLQNDSGTFVETLNGKTEMQVPVTLGIQDASGNVEIASGVTDGEKVINIGLK